MAGVRKAFRSERAVNDTLRLVIGLRKVGSYKQVYADLFSRSAALGGDR